MSEQTNSTRVEPDLLYKFSAAASGRASSDGEPIPERICFIHKGVEGLYYCRNCRVWRCKACARTYEGVAVCPDCDSLSIDATRLDELNKQAEEKRRPYAWHLTRAVSYPLRHLMFTTAAALAVWLTGAVTEALSNPTVVSFGGILTGPMVEWSGSGLAFAVAGVIAMSRLLSRVEGRECWKSLQIEDFDVLGEPVAFWMSAAFVGLGPLLLYVGFYKLKIVMIGLIVGVDAGAPPEHSLLRSVVICVLGLWAMFFYPMTFIVAGVRKNVLAILNPIASVSAWILLKRWLAPAFGIVAAVSAPAALLIYLGGDRRYGLASYSLLMTLTYLIAAQAIGAALCEGLERTNPEGEFRLKLPDLFDKLLR